MTVTVLKHLIDTLSPDDIERWRSMPVAVAVDVCRTVGQIDPAIRPLCPPGRQPRLFGKAVTARCEPPDFSAVLYALELIRPGDVLMIAAQGHAETAMIGEIIGGHLRRLGARGFVCDGAIRDVAELASWLDFSVFSRAITPRGPVVGERGAVNGEVMIGGCPISPGDLIIGDDDGLIALSPAAAREHIAAAEAKLALEAEWQASLAAGRSIAATFGLAGAI